MTASRTEDIEDAAVSLSMAVRPAAHKIRDGRMAPSPFAGIPWPYGGTAGMALAASASTSPAQLQLQGAQRAALYKAFTSSADSARACTRTPSMSP